MLTFIKNRIDFLLPANGKHAMIERSHLTVFPQNDAGMIHQEIKGAIPDDVFKPPTLINKG